MVRLEKVNSRNVWDLLELKVSGDQEHFVADNQTSIIEAYTTIAANGQVFPFGVYENDTPVGFVMIAYGTDDEWEDPPAVARDNYTIWRFMIDQKYQNKGYGRAALGQALDFIRTCPCGKAQLCWLSYETENDAARRLYRSFGFAETGEMNDDEVIAVLQL